LKGEIGLSLKKDRPRHEYKEVLISNLEEVNRISLILENLSTLLKFEEHKLVLQKTNLNINALLQKVLGNLKSLVKQRNIRIKLSPAKEIILEADENQFEMLFTNLLGSTVKYAPENDDISFSLIKKNNHAVIQIIGSAATELLNNQNQDLTLIVSRNIIKAHNGRIDVSRNVNKEAILSISFPTRISLKQNLPKG